MKKQLIILIVLSLSVLMLNADNERGLTNRDLNSEGLKCVGQAPSYDPSSIEENEEGLKSNMDQRSWELIDSLHIDSFVQAGEFIGVQYESSDNTLSIISNQGQLITESVEAIEKSPAWIRPDLENVLSQLSEINQLIWAEVINNATDPYIDEIAFSIAHSSVLYLSSPYCYPEIFTENALYIYMADIFLDYVEVVDYGNSNTDENYYSTTLYWKINENGEQVQVEVPRDIYYMYLVHPKITDEIPAFIDPDIIENNSTHNNNIVSPEEGVFWRYFLFNCQDAGYPLLRDELSNSSIAWDITGNTPDDAIHKITNWINDSMEFTSNSERPHQPVRIYKKHIGRCGEHADLTAATCRAALIPCTSILAISSDHTWNEFWDEEWIAWEPVNNMINNPLIFENSWGWNFASVFEIKSNGLLSPVTASYSEGSSNITIYALDSNGNPIDGAKIMLAVLSGSNIIVDNFGYTDNEGKYTFIVGEGRTYYARMDSEIGNDPASPNQVSLVASNTVNGQTYSNNLTASGVMPEIDLTEIPVPDDTIDDYLLEIDFTVSGQVIHGTIIMDDINNTEFYAASDDGLINLFMTDMYNYLLYENGDLFETFNYLLDVDEGNIEFNMPVPEDDSWFVLFDNSNNLNNPQHLTSSVSLYSYNPSGLEEFQIAPASCLLQQNYPNPFNPTTTISFSVAQTSSFVTLDIYNIKGQKVKSLVNEKLDTGTHHAIWDGKDENGKSATSGIYFCQLKAGKDFSQTKRMILLK